MVARTRCDAVPEKILTQTNAYSVAKTAPQPYMYTRQEVRAFGARYWTKDRNRNAHTAMLDVTLEDQALMLKGFVEDSRHGFYHYVVAPLDMAHIHDVTGNGVCDCESAQHGGKPCEHVIRLRNIYIRHRRKLDALFGVPRLRTVGNGEE